MTAESICEASSGEFLGLGDQGMYCLLGVRWLQFQSEIDGDREAVVMQLRPVDFCF